ncbi:DNA-protecting protein DprA, partial [Achromobacter insolitus]|nr:DNA-protecting protein DprA [Achromobacter insolitus]
AIPGSIHSPLSRGCHALIRQGAKLVETARDITDELGGNPTPATRAQPAAAPLPDHPVLDALGYDPLHLDAVQARSGMDTASLQAQLVELELQGRIVRLDDGRYQRLN